MPLAKTEGVILKRIRLGETSKILTVLTPEYGKVRLVAKGARKPRHRFGSSMEPFMVCGIVFYHREGRDLQLLSQCDTLQAFPQFSGDLVRLAYGSGVLELADRVVYGAESSGDLYALVVETIGLMAEAVRADLPLFWWVYQLKTAERVGYLPELGRCDRCGRQISGGRVLFSPEAGSVRCAKCGGGGEMSVSAGSLRALQFLSQADWTGRRDRESARAVPGRPVRGIAADQVARDPAVDPERENSGSERLWTFKR